MRQRGRWTGLGRSLGAGVGGGMPQPQAFPTLDPVLPCPLHHLLCGSWSCVQGQEVSCLGKIEG